MNDWTEMMWSISLCLIKVKLRAKGFHFLPSTPPLPFPPYLPTLAMYSYILFYYPDFICVFPMREG